MNKQVLSIWGCVEAVSDEEVERGVCVYVCAGLRTGPALLSPSVSKLWSSERLGSS